MCSSSVATCSRPTSLSRRIGRRRTPAGRLPFVRCLGGAQRCDWPSRQVRLRIGRRRRPTGHLDHPRWHGRDGDRSARQPAREVRRVPFIRYCGANSIVLYISFTIPMALTRVVLLKTGVIQDTGLGLVDRLARRVDDAAAGASDPAANAAALTLRAATVGGATLPGGGGRARRNWTRSRPPPRRTCQLVFAHGAGRPAKGRPAPPRGRRDAPGRGRGLDDGAKGPPSGLRTAVDLKHLAVDEHASSFSLTVPAGLRRAGLHLRVGGATRRAAGAALTMAPRDRRQVCVPPLT